MWILMCPYMSLAFYRTPVSLSRGVVLIDRLLFQCSTDYLCVWRPAFQFLTVFIQLRSFCISISSAAFCAQTPKVPCRACIDSRQTTWSLPTCCSKCSIPTCIESAKEAVRVQDLTSDQALDSHIFAFVSFYHVVLLTVNGPMQYMAENLLQLSGDLGPFCSICPFFSSHSHCILHPTLYCQLW